MTSRAVSFRGGWLAGVLLIALAACAGSDAAVVEVGRPAPSYAAVDLQGDSVSLAGLRGRPVLLNIWATWCAPCREEIPYLQQLHDRHGAAGLEIVGVSVDTRGEERKIAEFAAEMGMTYPLWHDPDERVSAVFLALGVPASYLIDRDGVLRWRHLGVLRESNAAFQAALASALDAAAAR